MSLQVVNVPHRQSKKREQERRESYFARVSDSRNSEVYPLKSVRVRPSQQLLQQDAPPPKQPSLNLSISSDSQVKWSLAEGHVDKKPLIKKSIIPSRPQSIPGSLDVQLPQHLVGNINFDSGQSNQQNGGSKHSSSKSVLDNVREELLKAI